MVTNNIDQGQELAEEISVRPPGSKHHEHELMRMLTNYEVVNVIILIIMIITIIIMIMIMLTNYDV